MKFFLLSLALVVLLAIPNQSHGFGINVEAETRLGDRFRVIKKLRKKRYAKLRQGIHERITVEALDDAERRLPYSERHPKMRKQVIYGLLIFFKIFSKVSGSSLVEMIPNSLPSCSFPEGRE